LAFNVKDNKQQRIAVGGIALAQLSYVDVSQVTPLLAGCRFDGCV